MVRSFILLLTLFIHPGCEEPAALTADNQMNTSSPGTGKDNGQSPSGNQNAAYRYLALGDSYTIGEGVRESERFPEQLADTLLAEGYGEGGLLVIARTGWTTGSLLNALAAQKPSADYDLVTLLIGVNNQYQGRPVEEYREQFSWLLDSAIRYAQGKAEKVVVLSIPDYGVTPFAASHNPGKISQEIDLYNSINREISRVKGARYVDITPISREAGKNSSLIATDGLHPSEKMYALWVSKMKLEVTAALERP